MTVLPQLERELSAAHARRRRHLPRIGPGMAPVALAAAVAVAVIVVAVVALRSGPPRQHPSGTPTVVYRGTLDLTYAAGGSLYGVPRGQLANGTFRLVRIDPSTGGVAARFDVAPPADSLGQPDPLPQHVLLAAGSMWMTASDSHRTWLWRLDPHTLAVRSLTLLPGGGAGNTGSIAVAGGWLWAVNVNTLIRVSLTTGRLAGSRIFSHAQGGQGNSIAGDSSGNTLVVTVANGPTFAAAPGVVRRIGFRVYRLDPDSGAPIAASAIFPGFTPELAGVLDGGAWINGFTGIGSPARVDVRTLRATAEPRQFPLSAQVFDRSVQFAGRGGLWCVDPVSGRRLATLPVVLAAEGTTAYVQVRPHGVPEIRRETLDPRCLRRP